MLGSHEKMDVARTRGGEQIIDVALAIGDDGDHGGAGQRALGRAQAVKPAPALAHGDRASLLALRLARFAPARRRFRSRAHEGVRQSDNAPAMADVGGARPGLCHQHRVQEEPDVLAVAHHAEAALAALVAGEVDLGRVLDRQHVPAERRPRRMVGRRRDHRLKRHAPVVKKAPEPLRPGAVAAKPP